MVGMLFSIPVANMKNGLITVRSHLRLPPTLSECLRKTRFGGSLFQNAARGSAGQVSLARFSLSALLITRTELEAIAAPAMIGLRRMPKNG